MRAAVSLGFACLVAGAAQGLAGQDAGLGVVRGYVFGADRSEPLAGAVVYAKESPHTTVANSIGFYELAVPEGLWILSTFHARGEALGVSGAPSSLVAVSAGDTVDADFTFAGSPGGRMDPYVLEGIEVFVERARVSLQRREGARIDVIESEVIRELETSARHVGDVIRARFASLRVREPDASTLCIESRRIATINPRNTGCPGMVAVLVDDVLVVEPETYLPALPPNAIERVEYIPGIVAGARFGTNANNGVLLIWTRRP